MKVFIKNDKKVLDEEDISIVIKFLKFLQKKMSLSNKIVLSFLSKRNGSMTTGVRKPNGSIDILAGNRLLIDILRTISHEWVHEYQYQIMGLSEKKGKIKDIGGPEENMANIISGIFIKKFQKQNPKLTKKLYGE